MQIIELYIKGYKRLNGSAKIVNPNKLEDTTANFTGRVSVGDIVTNLNTNKIAKITAIDSNTRLSINDDIFTDLDTYRIESDYIRADLFEDESVVITDSLLNIKDISKVFTPFSKQFNLPASKNNSGLFKYYENTDVQNGFDARYRHDAIIKLNGIDYKKGKIQFQSVTLKNNKAHAYKIVFFGDTVELKEILGDAKLSSLNYGDMDFEYTSNNISALFINTDSDIQSAFGSLDLLVPNITHTKNMRFTSSGYRDLTTNTNLLWTDLKPAIRIQAIVQAINRTYPLNITGTIADATRYNKFYMWMHKNIGFVTNAQDGENQKVTSSRWRHQEDNPNDYAWVSTTSSFGVTGDVRTAYIDPITVVGGTFNYEYYNVTVNITSGTTDNYDLRIYDSENNQVFGQWSGISGNASYGVDITTRYTQRLVDFTVEITSENTISMTHSVVVTKYHRVSALVTNTIYVSTYNAVSPNVQNTFIVADQMPDMKVIDFLNGLFKMFNLVVFKEGDNIVTREAPFYMTTGVSYDITKYVDMENASMERLFQYKEMDFNFESKESFLVRKADKITGGQFAELTYGNDEWDGETYELELPFEKMMYERLNNEDTGALSVIGQGAMLDDNFEPTIGKPLILCIERTADPDSQVQFNGLNYVHYRRPSNLSDFSWGGSTRLALNFGEEMDEYLLEMPSATENLFSHNYFDYVETVFNRQSRLLKVTAYLPLSLLVKYNLNDRFIINNKSYRINTVKTNLLTNKTELELYNKDEFASQVANNQVAYLERLAQDPTFTTYTNRITVNWNILPSPIPNNIQGYTVYKNGGIYQNVGYDIDALTVAGLSPDSTYDISVSVRYNISGQILYSFPKGDTVRTDPPPSALAENNDTLITELGDTIILE